MTNYFIQGFKLLNKNIEIYLIAAMFWFVAFSGELFPTMPSFLKNVLILIALPQFTYEFSIPQLIIRKQKGKKLDTRYLVSTLWSNFKRLLLPGFLVFVLFIIAIIVVLFIAASLLGESVPKMFESLSAAPTNPLSTSNMIFNLFSSSLFAFLVFTATFFSVEKKGFLTAIKDSFLFSYVHISYTIVLFMIFYITYFVSTYISNLGKAGPLTSSLFNEYVYLIFVVSSLLYYQKHKKDKIGN